MLRGIPIRFHVSLRFSQLFKNKRKQNIKNLDECALFLGRQQFYRPPVEVIRRCFMCLSRQPQRVTMAAGSGPDLWQGHSVFLRLSTRCQTQAFGGTIQLKLTFELYITQNGDILCCYVFMNFNFFCCRSGRSRCGNHDGVSCTDWQTGLLIKMFRTYDVQRQPAPYITGITECL